MVHYCKKFEYKLRMNKKKINFIPSKFIKTQIYTINNRIKIKMDKNDIDDIVQDEEDFLFVEVKFKDRERIDEGKKDEEVNSKNNFTFERK